MNNYKGFLIDLDGTIYRGNEKIPEAVQFVQELYRRELPYLFVTNNSTKKPEQVAAHLQSMDVPAEAADVFTTSMATATYIANKKSEAKVYMIGEEGLQAALETKQLQLVDKDPHFVVIGLDRKLTYEKLAKATLFIREGAIFVATNGDTALPSERGFLPGNGAIVSAVATSTNTKPTFIGKPETIIINQALNVLGTKKEETLMIGDNYATDISAGIRAQLHTLLVYTGVTTKEQLAKYDKKPTYELESLADWTFD